MNSKQMVNKFDKTVNSIELTTISKESTNIEINLVN